MAALRQPWCSASHASNGRKTSWPVAPAAVRTPVTRPRRATNQRPVTVATRLIAMAPVPSPTTMPQQSTSCHDAVIQIGSSEPTLTSTRAVATTRWMPSRSMSAAENGAASPKSTRLTDTAPPMTPIGQPNSSCSGVMSTPGVDRNPAAPMIVRKVTTATHQAGWMRWRRARRPGGPVGVARGAGSRIDAGCAAGGSGRLTGRLCTDSRPADEWPDGHHVQESGHAPRTRTTTPGGGPRARGCRRLRARTATPLLPRGRARPGVAGPAHRGAPALRGVDEHPRRRARPDLGGVCRPPDPSALRDLRGRHDRPARHQQLRDRHARPAAGVSRRARCDGETGGPVALDLHRRLRARRPRQARRTHSHDALGLCRPLPATLPGGPAGPRGALRRPRRRAHVGRQRGRHRPAAARAAQRPRRRRRQPGGPRRRRGAVARRAVRPSSSSDPCPTRPSRAPGPPAPGCSTT